MRFYIGRSLFLPVKLLRSVNASSFSHFNTMELKEVVSRLDTFAPLSLAAKWDNVGLLVEPSAPHIVQSVLLTNDLTEAVLQEAVEKKVGMVLSYHPPIFVPLKRLTSQSFKERIVVKAIENRIAVYSPHTAFDAVQGGVNDWLASGLGQGHVEPLQPSKQSSSRTKVVSVVPMEMADQAKKIQETLNAVTGVETVNVEVINRLDNRTELSLSVTCTSKGLADTLCVLQSQLPKNAAEIEMFSLEKEPIPNTGEGRLCTLHSPVSMSELISRIKKHLKLHYVRLAVSGHVQSPANSQQRLQTVALCAGSGASVLRGVQADVYLTGEMSHHEVLDAVSRGTHVILCEHSNTERGYLHVFREKLTKLLEGRVEVFVSCSDADPLQVV